MFRSAKITFLCFLQLFSIFAVCQAQSFNNLDYIYTEGNQPEKEFLSDFSILQLNFSADIDQALLQEMDSEETLGTLREELFSREADVVCIKGIPNSRIAEFITNVLRERFTHIFCEIHNQQDISLIASILPMTFPQNIEITENKHLTEFSVVRESSESTSIFLFNDSLDDMALNALQLKKAALFAENKLLLDPQSTFIFCLNTRSFHSEQSSSTPNNIYGIIHADLGLIDDFIENGRNINAGFALRKLSSLVDLDLTQGYEAHSLIEIESPKNFFNQESTLTKFLYSQDPAEFVMINNTYSREMLARNEKNDRAKGGIEISRDSDGNTKIEGSGTYSRDSDNGSKYDVSIRVSHERDANGNSKTSGEASASMNYMN